MSKRARIIAAVAVIAVIGVVALILARGSRGSGPQIDTATVQKHELAVTVTASGKVDAGIQADVFPPTQGTLATVYVKDGQKVKAGQKLAAMDTDPLKQQVAQAKSGVSQAKAQQASVSQQAASPADITAAQANVTATHEAYLAALEQASSVVLSGPSSAQIDAAEAATVAAHTAYNNANALYQAYPSNDATKAALLAAKEQANAAYLSAKANESKLKNTSLAGPAAQADAGVAQAFAAWKGAQAQLVKLEGASTSKQEAAAAEGVAAAEEVLRLAEKALDDSVLKAPIDGVVVFNSPATAASLGAASSGGGGATVGGKVAEGSAVSPASAPFTVVDLNALNFTAEVDEADVNRVKVGMNVDITLDAFPGETFKSQVVRINPVAQPTATGGTIFEVEVALDDTGKDILIGMKGDATIKVSSQANALTVPVEALFSEGGTDYVYVVTSASKLKKTEIRVGATTDTEVEVMQGLKEGDVVALSGSTQYVDGMQVRVKGK